MIPLLLPLLSPPDPSLHCLPLRLPLVRFKVLPLLPFLPQPRPHPCHVLHVSHVTARAAAACVACAGSACSALLCFGGAAAAGCDKRAQH